MSEEFNLVSNVPCLRKMIKRLGCGTQKSLIKIAIAVLIVLTANFIFAKVGFSETYFYAIKEGKIYKEDKMESGIVGAFKIGNIFLAGKGAGDGWVALWKSSTTDIYERIGYALSKDGIIVSSSKIDGVAKEAQKKLAEIRAREKQRREEKEQIEKLQQESTRYMTLLEENLRIGMRLSDISSFHRAIHWELISRNTNVNGTTEMYKWKTPRDKNLYLMFHNGVLISYTEMP